MGGILAELKKRRVYQAAAVYAIAAWGLAQAVDFVATRLFLPAWIPTLTATVFVVGFPVVILLSWSFDFRADGIVRAPPSKLHGIASLTLAVTLLVGGSALLYSFIGPRQIVTQTSSFSAPPNSIAVLPFSTFGEA